VGRRDPRAEFTDWVVARRPRLRRLAYALCGDWHTADDLVQTALAKLYVAWPTVQRRDAMDAYCLRIITRARIDEHRRSWRRETPGLEGFDVASRESDPALRPDLVRALAALPEMQRKVVVLRHWWGLSVAESAAQLGIGEGTVKSHSSRALARLAELMTDSHEGAPS
jgi:RNA polymerase sigma-70 factor (sigma-E family)